MLENRPQSNCVSRASSENRPAHPGCNRPATSSNSRRCPNQSTPPRKRATVASSSRSAGGETSHASDANSACCCTQNSSKAASDSRFMVYVGKQPILHSQPEETKMLEHYSQIRFGVRRSAPLWICCARVNPSLRSMSQQICSGTLDHTRIELPRPF